MEKLKDKVRFSIKFKFLILIVSIILFISTCLVMFFVVKSRDELEKEIKKRRLSEVKNLAHDVEYAVLTENNTLLDNMISGRMMKPDIIYVEIKGYDERVLAKHKKPGYDEFSKDDAPIVELEEVVYRSSLSSIDGRIAYEFSAPILTEKITREGYGNELDNIMMGGMLNEASYLLSTIGKVKMAFSLENVDKQTSQLLFISILIVFVVVAVSILVSIFFTNMIVLPIRKGAQTAIEISEGDLAKKVDVISSDETGILASNFNKVSISLKKTVYKLAKEITKRIQAVHNLRDSESKYRKLIESANDAIFIADAETGIIIDINKSDFF